LYVLERRLTGKGSEEKFKNSSNDKLCIDDQKTGKITSRALLINLEKDGSNTCNVLFIRRYLALPRILALSPDRPL
jgi:hypothetical protein